MVQLRYVLGLILLASYLQSTYSISNPINFPLPSQYDPYRIFNFFTHAADPQYSFLLLIPKNSSATTNLYVLRVDVDSLTIVASATEPYLYPVSGIAFTGAYNPSQGLFVLILGYEPDSTIITYESVTLAKICSYVFNHLVGVGPKGIWVGNSTYLPAYYPSPTGTGYGFYAFTASTCNLDSTMYITPTNITWFSAVGFNVNEKLYFGGTVNRQLSVIKGVFNPTTHFIDVTLTQPITTPSDTYNIFAMHPINSTQLAYYSTSGQIYISSLDSLQIVNSFTPQLPQSNHRIRALIISNEYIVVYSSVNTGSARYFSQYSYDGQLEPGVVQILGAPISAIGNYLLSLYVFSSNATLVRWTLD